MKNSVSMITNSITKIMACAIFLAISSLSAQHKPDKDKIKSLKVAFLTERLELSSKQAQDFWPIYNKYEDKRAAMREREREEIHSKIREAENLSEAAADKLIDQYLSFEEEEEELDKAFIKDISAVISSKKTLLLLRSEHEFKKQLLRQYRHKKGSR